jgi:ABC-type Fe3+/spermidine/putrescine transport system ATPase subunit
VDGLTLSAKRGEILALLGPSGCGKTTALRLIAGFEVPEAGVVELGGKVMTGGRTFVPPERRGVGMVFQDYALFPHLTVEANVSFGLAKLAPALRARRARAALDMVGLGPLAKRYPHELSGGQQQRVALARALAPEPTILLLDEPLVSLDAPLKQEMMAQLKEIQRRLGVTTLYITHDQTEAMQIADRLAIMRAGRIEQTGLPEEVYRRPQTRFAATFLGRAILLEAWVQAGRAETALGTFPIRRPDGRVTLALRPEHLRLDAKGAVRGRFVRRLFLGQEGVAYLMEVNGLRLYCPGPSNGMPPPEVGQEVGLTVAQQPVALED